MMRFSGFVTGVLLCAALAHPVLGDSGKETSDKLVLAAQAAAAGGETSQAQLLFERALAANPANIAAHIGIGQMHDAQGRIGRSLKYYRQALSIEPLNEKALRLQAYAYLKRDLVEYAARNADRLEANCKRECGLVADLRGAIALKRAEGQVASADSNADGR